MNTELLKTFATALRKLHDTMPEKFDIGEWWDHEFSTDSDCGTKACAIEWYNYIMPPDAPKFDVEWNELIHRNVPEYSGLSLGSGIAQMFDISEDDALLLFVSPPHEATANDIADLIDEFISK